RSSLLCTPLPEEAIYQPEPVDHLKPQANWCLVTPDLDGSTGQVLIDNCQGANAGGRGVTDLDGGDFDLTGHFRQGDLQLLSIGTGDISGNHVDHQRAGIGNAEAGEGDTFQAHVAAVGIVIGVHNGADAAFEVTRQANAVLTGHACQGVVIHRLEVGLSHERSGQKRCSQSQLVQFHYCCLHSSQMGLSIDTAATPASTVGPLTAPYGIFLVGRKALSSSCEQN